jgi:hypothetical protein
VANKAGRLWYEADINYTDGVRKGFSERLVYSDDGLIFKSNHYSDWVQIK